jgi:nucleotide-binding universal stress UspA family protein
MQDREDAPLERIGVGFDGGPESQAALDLAGSIAAAAGGELVVRGVAAEREHAGLADAALAAEREHAGLADAALAAARTTGARVQIDVTPGHVTEALYALCRQVDLVVIGSCRRGAPGRILLGRTGQALLRDAPSPMLVVPRPVS